MVIESAVGLTYIGNVCMYAIVELLDCPITIDL